MLRSFSRRSSQSRSDCRSSSSRHSGRVEDHLVVSGAGLEIDLGRNRFRSEEEEARNVVFPLKGNPPGRLQFGLGAHREPGRAGGQSAMLRRVEEDPDHRGPGHDHRSRWDQKAADEIVAAAEGEGRLVSARFESPGGCVPGRFAAYFFFAFFFAAGVLFGRDRACPGESAIRVDGRDDFPAGRFRGVPFLLRSLCRRTGGDVVVFPGAVADIAADSRWRLSCERCRWFRCSFRCRRIPAHVRCRPSRRISRWRRRFRLPSSVSPTLTRRLTRPERPDRDDAAVPVPRL